MTDEFNIGQLPEGSVAWCVSLYGYEDMVTWAPTAAKARYNCAKCYWDAGCGRRGEWPRFSVSRYPLLDNSHLPKRFKRRVMSLQDALHA